MQDVPTGRKTKVVCTMGPACWSEPGIGKLLDCGMDVARVNFSNPAIADKDHQEVLDRLRKVGGWGARGQGLGTGFRTRTWPVLRSLQACRL